ncbi:MAG TPA: PilZ domain-containing protein [Myxococcota bacterium]|jgi:hypothetical protein|nr:PilZ domain-containing protein [Myxococcota bacterium]HON24322.1 PilZ domain-containing protein [Myxococcota bacterium]HOS60919.1 PilZ domain-containing protein [Myxococcota bacterium]HPC90688.1 PilZ domain-containing protein [Myxococcota bacterium]HPL24063.1 PilZ domain-containing protein [Myxococcota bacterium]
MRELWRKEASEILRICECLTGDIVSWREVHMESRRNQRVPLKIKALPLEGGSTEPLETIEISAGGALFFGNPGVPAGSIIWIQLEPTNNTGLPLNIQLRVVRLVQSPDGTVTGFGAQWIRIFSQDSIEPLQLFLKRTLSITSGFIQTVPAGGEFQGPLYLYVFPAGYESAPSSGAAEPVAQPQPKPSGTQAIFAEVPLTWSADGQEFEGRAVKMSTHAMRVATSANPPGTYKRISITLPTGGRGRNAWLTLEGTVATQRAPSQEGDSGVFDVTFTLGNTPDALNQYRILLERLSSPATPHGI